MLSVVPSIVIRNGDQYRNRTLTFAIVNTFFKGRCTDIVDFPDVYKRQAVEYPQQIAKYEELTAAYEADIAHLDTAMNTPFSMEIHGITYDNEKTAGEILVQACTKMKKEHTDAADIGTFKGFKMKVSYSLFDNSFYVKLTRESSVTVEVKKDPVRNIERILTALRKMPGQKDVAEERLEGARQQLVDVYKRQA